MDVRAIMTIASQEARCNVRNKWTILFALVFGALSLAIAWFGLVTAGLAGFQGFTRTTASLLNLVLYLVPIVGLAMGSLSLTGEKGANELLFSQPVTRSEILLGKIHGLFLSVVTAMFFGFGVTGVVIALAVGHDGVWRYLSFVGYSLLLTLVFLSLGALAAVLSGTKAKALAYSLFLWFFFVLFYDLFVIGLTFVLTERAANRFIFLSLFGNPVDMVRVSSLITLSDAAVFGPAGAALVKFLGGRAASNLLLLSGLVVWAVCPLLVADRVLRNQDL